MDVGTKSQVKSAEISAKIIRADGSVEELGSISYWHANPFKRAAYKIRKLFKRSKGV